MTNQELKSLKSIDITKLTKHELMDINETLSKVIYNDEYKNKFVGMTIIPGKPIDSLYRACESLSNAVRREILSR